MCGLFVCSCVVCVRGWGCFVCVCVLCVRVRVRMWVVSCIILSACARMCVCMDMCKWAHLTGREAHTRRVGEHALALGGWWKRFITKCMWCVACLLVWEWMWVRTSHLDEFRCEEICYRCLGATCCYVWSRVWVRAILYLWCFLSFKSHSYLLLFVSWLQTTDMQIYMQIYIKKWNYLRNKHCELRREIVCAIPHYFETDPLCVLWLFLNF